MNDTPTTSSRRGRRYAEGTNVSSIQSRIEIETLVQRFGARNFTTHQGADEARIGFEINGRKVLFVLTLPNRNDRDITHVNKGRTYESWHMRSPDSQARRYEEATRERWRALALLIKAKLAAVSAGITSTEDEFLPQTIVPTKNGAATVSEVMQGQITEAYTRGMVPGGLNLLALGPGRE